MLLMCGMYGGVLLTLHVSAVDATGGMCSPLHNKYRRGLCFIRHDFAGYPTQVSQTLANMQCDKPRQATSLSGQLRLLVQAVLVCLGGSARRGSPAADD